MKKATYFRFISKIQILHVLIFLSNIGFAQITGKIVDEMSFPLEYATAAIYNQETNVLVTGVITNTNGVFVFENLKKGTYYIESSFIGYEGNTIRDIVVSNPNKALDLGTIQLVLGNTLKK